MVGHSDPEKNLAVAARIGNVGFDCNDVVTVATFWSGALDRPFDEGSSDVFASIG
jgi:hypothetical protein